MEYTKLITLKNDLLKRDKPTAVYLTNPIDRYNFFVDQFNIDYIRLEDQKMLRLSGQAIYSICHLLQEGLFNYIVIFMLIPLILYFSRLLIEFEGFFFIIYSFYFILLLIISFFTIVIYLKAKYTYQKNLKRVSNPFRRMIYHPDLCRMLNVNNTHLEYNIDQIDNLNMTEAQVNIIISNQIVDGRAKFMIYDQGFIDFYSEIGQYNIYLLKHIVWLVSSIGFYLLFIFINSESD
jgi:hypothetical protein